MNAGATWALDAIRGPRNIAANRVMHSQPRERTWGEVGSRAAWDVGEGAAGVAIPGALHTGYNLLSKPYMPSDTQLGGKLYQDAKNALKYRPEYGPNRIRSTELEVENPGTKFPIGDAIDSGPHQNLLNKSAAAHPEVAEQYRWLKRDNVAAGEKRLGQDFTETQGAEDVKGPLRAERGRLQTEAQDRFGAQKAEVGGLQRAENAQVTGREIETTQERYAKEAWKRVDEEYTKLGSGEINAHPLVKAYESVMDEMSTGTERMSPTYELNKFKSALFREEEDPITHQVTLVPRDTIDIQDVVALDKMIHFTQRQIAGNPEMELVRRQLGMLEAAVEKTIGQSPSFAKQYKIAKNAMTGWAERYRSGEMLNIRRGGLHVHEPTEEAIMAAVEAGQPIPFGRRLAMPSDRVAGQFWSLHGADDLIRGVGQEDAARIMEGHAAMLLKQNGAINPVTGAVNQTKLQNFLNGNNGEILKKYGIYDKFTSVDSAAEQFAVAEGKLKEFNKGEFGKLLKTDPDKIMDQVLSGKQMGEKFDQLYEAVRGDPNALAGLKVAYKDWVIRSMGGSGGINGVFLDVLNKPEQMTQRLAQTRAIAAKLYADEPEKLAALDRFRDVVNTTYRQELGKVKGSAVGGMNQASKPLEDTLRIKIAQGLAESIPGLKYLMRPWTKFAHKSVEGELQQRMMDGLKLAGQALLGDADLAQTLMDTSLANPFAARNAQRWLYVKATLTGAIGGVEGHVQRPKLRESERRKALAKEQQKKGGGSAAANPNQPLGQGVGTKGGTDDYDMEAYKASGAPYPLPPGQHYPDKFKKDSHITKGDWRYLDRDGNRMPDLKEDGTPNPGGAWHFYPSETNLKYHTPEEYERYFKEQEKDSVLHLPGVEVKGESVADVMHPGRGDEPDRHIAPGGTQIQDTQLGEMVKDYGKNLYHKNIAPWTQPIADHTGEGIVAPYEITEGIIAGRGATGWVDAEKQLRGQFSNLYDFMERFEIPDFKARFKGGAFHGMTVEGVERQPVQIGPLTFWQPEDVNARPLWRILDHPELYKAYPELENFPVVLTESNKFAGSFNGKIIRLNPDFDEVDQLKTLLHEIQHWVQRKEGFGEGSTGLGSGPLFEKYLEEELTNRGYYSLEFNSIPGIKEFGRNELGLKNWHSSSVERKYRAKYGEQIDKKWDIFSKANKEAKRKAYHNSPGELEANDVKFRKDIPPDQLPHTLIGSGRTVDDQNFKPGFNPSEKQLGLSLADKKSVKEGKVIDIEPSGAASRIDLREQVLGYNKFGDPVLQKDVDAAQVAMMKGEKVDLDRVTAVSKEKPKKRWGRKKVDTDE
jgi:hypothetical protein